MKKVISLLMSFVMLFSIISSVNLSAYAEESATSGKCGDNVYWNYDEGSKTLTISGTGAMDDFYSIGNAPWWGYHENILTVKIETGVTTIGDAAFLNCSSLTSATIPNSVTLIKDFAFYECSSLLNIDVSSGNLNYFSENGVLFDKNKSELIQYPIGNQRIEYTIPNSVTTIGDSAFSWCKSLKSLTIPNSVTTIGESAFES